MAEASGITLANVSKPERVLTPPLVLVYGVGGIGKSTFGAAFPEPVFIDVEHGSHHLDVARFDGLKGYADVMSAIGALYREDHQFKTVVVDSLDKLELMIQAEACRRNGWQSIESADYGKGYVEAAGIFQEEILGGLNALRNDRGMTVVIIAHGKATRFSPPETDPYDRWAPRVHARISDMAVEGADMVGFCGYETSIAKSSDNFGKVRTRGVGSGQRLVRWQERPAWVAKSRFELPPEMPLDFEEFAAALEISRGAPLVGTKPSPKKKET